MHAGDHTIIAKETAWALGMGTNIQGSDGLPMLDKDGNPPSDLHTYTRAILEADGFAKVPRACLT